MGVTFLFWSSPGGGCSEGVVGAQKVKALKGWWVLFQFETIMYCASPGSRLSLSD